MPYKKVVEPPKTIRVRKNDMVKVIAGRDKGKTGRVLDVNRKTGRVLVEGVMMVKRHTRANPQKQIKGGIAEKESSIHVSNVMVMTSGGPNRWVDPDTYVAADSLSAARLAAGAALRGALAVATGEAEVAFAVVRPPGHHASSTRAGGFCLVNNVAVAAMGLREAGLARRIGIVDWDVHHGDGTQAIFDADPEVAYASTHQWMLYPGTGNRRDRGRGPGEGTMHNVPLRPGAGDADFVAAWRDELVPALEAFRPEAILVSAGYDAHAADPLAHL